jgi:hypothetical protein
MDSVTQDASVAIPAGGWAYGTVMVGEAQNGPEVVLASGSEAEYGGPVVSMTDEEEDYYLLIAIAMIVGLLAYLLGNPSLLNMLFGG